MPGKQELFDELFPLMRENGTEPELLLLMQEPQWLEKVSLENLNFLLGKHRELKATREANAGIWERWNRARGENP